jgi:membrane protein DedA with SNARE-associated domain
VSGFIARLIPYISHYGYWAVAGAVLPEGFGIPTPGETALIAASLLASRGEMSIVATLAAAFLAAFLGNTLGYAVGYYGGRPLVLGYGRYFFITEDRLRKGEAFFTRYGPAIILAARFLDIFRQLNGIVSGMTGMPFLRFQYYNIIGAILWVGFWGGLAYWLGHTMETMHPLFTNIKYALLAILFAAVIGLVIYKFHARKNGNS